jgi:arylsulfatase A-like enzyme
MRYSWLPVLVFTLAALFGGNVAWGDAPPRPNIVVILADDLGSHDVGWRGSEIKTPNLDALAEKGARLNQFYVQPLCSPTRAALLTGRYPFRYGFQTGVVRPWAQYGVPLEERFLSVALREAGYETAIVGKWHLGHFKSEYLPTRRGFDHQYGHYNGALDYFTHIRDGGFDWHRDDKENHDEGYSTELIAREAERVIKERDKQKPLFLYVPFNGVHTPLQVPEKYSQPYTQFKGNRKTYAGMVTALDEAVGRIVAALRDEKLLANTLIFFSSDNGGPNPGTLTSNGKLRAGKGTVYEGGVRVCAFAHWEGHIPAGDVDSPIHVTDWYPTLLHLAGAKTDQSLPIDGHNIWPVLTKKGESTRTEIVINSAPEVGAIRSGDWKLVVRSGNNNAKGGKEQVELYQLAQDPSEATNVAKAHPEIVKELKAKLAAYASQAVPPKTRPAPPGFKAPRVWGQAD